MMSVSVAVMGVVSVGSCGSERRNDSDQGCTSDDGQGGGDGHGLMVTVVMVVNEMVIIMMVINMVALVTAVGFA